MNKNKLTNIDALENVIEFDDLESIDIRNNEFNHKAGKEWKINSWFKTND